EAVERASSAAGVPISSIDGVAVAKSGELHSGDLPALELAEHLGVRPRWIDTTLAGGAGPVIQVARAAAAITSEQCTFAVVSYASTQASRRLRRSGGWQTDPDTHAVAFEAATGWRHPIGVHAL